MSVSINTTIEILGDLVQIQNDRILYYEHVSKHLLHPDPKLEALITQTIAESNKHKLDLTSEIQNFGIIDHKSIYRGKIYKDWLDKKTAFEENNLSSALENFKNLEDVILNTYKAALQEELDLNSKKLIEVQLSILSESLELIKSLSDQI